MVLKPNFKQFFDFMRLEEVLKSWSAAAPELCQLHIIGTSHRNRPIYALEISNFSQGSPAERPGYYVEACIHAEEVMGTNVAMYIAWHLLSKYNQDPLVTALLDNQIFYILPRVNPDGAEFVMQQGHPWCGNGKYLPGEEQPGDGFVWKDLDNNGVIAQMRIEDSDGEWKISEYDSRFMVLREPWEQEGVFYRLLPEGEFNNYDGVLQFPKPRDGNLNRQFPASYFPEGRQYGAGDVPLQEPEAKAVADFILAHPNIGGVMSYHTNAGAILRPFGDKTDEHFKGQDLKLYETLGQIGTEITRYPLISVYHGFTPNKDAVRGGCLDDWTYEFLGIPSFVTELWNVNQAAGIRQEGFYPSNIRTAKEEQKVLEYLEQFLSKPYLTWQEFDHPQLGKVEIGGWDRIWVVRNAPPTLLEEIAVEHCEFTVKLAATLPRLTIKEVAYERLGGDLFRITAIIGNSGYLPTYLTEQARFMKSDSPVMAKLVANDKFELVEGSLEVNLGHLEGRSQRKTTWSQWGPLWNPVVKKASWIVRCPQNVAFTITATNHKSGKCQKEIVIR